VFEPVDEPPNIPVDAPPSYDKLLLRTVGPRPCSVYRVNT
jgi:hypothetical protein